MSSVVFHSPRKISLNTPPGEGTLKVLITTHAGGMTTSEVCFQYEPRYATSNWKVERDLEIDVWREEYDVDTAVSIQPGHTSTDPLDIGIAPRLILASGPEMKLDKTDPLMDLQRLYPGASSSLSSEQFQPSWLLVERYQRTTFDQFKKGLSNLRRTVRQHEDTTFNLLNANASVFIECFEALSDVHSNIELDLHKSQGDIVRTFERTLLGVVKKGTELFTPLLERRRDAERDRNALNVLTSYRFLFNLPHSMKRNLKMEAWAQIIADYKKADTLFRATTVPAFTKVMAEVDRLANVVRETLFSRLEKLPSTIQEQERLIRFLNELAVTEDPVWFCLQKQYKFIQDEIVKCVNTREHALRHQQKATEQTTIGTSWAKLRAAVSVHRSLSATKTGPFTAWRLRHQQQQPDYALLDTPDSNSLTTAAKPSRVIFIESISRIVSEYLPGMWRLGQLTNNPPPQMHQPSVTSSMSSIPTLQSASVISTPMGGTAMAFGLSSVGPAGAGAGASAGGAGGASAGALKLPATRNAGRRTSIVLPDAFSMEPVELDADTNETRAKLADLIFQVMTEYTTHVRAQFSIEDDDGARSWLPHCEGQIRACHRILSLAGLPRRAIALLDNLLSDLHTHTVAAIFATARKTIKGLMAEENWIPEAHCTHTHLPVLFSAALRTAFDTLQDLLAGSAVPATSMAEKMVEQLFCECVDAFATLLSDTATQFASLPLCEGLAIKLQAGEDVTAITEPNAEYKLTCLLANTLYCRENSIPDLLERFTALQISPSSLVRKSSNNLAALQTKLFTTILDRYSAVLNKTLDGAVADQWNLIVPTLVPRSYARTFLLTLVQIHAVTHSAARTFVSELLTSLLLSAADHLRGIYSELPKLEPYCLLLLQVELLVMRRVLTILDDDNQSTWLFAMDALQAAPVLTKTRTLPSMPSTTSKRSLPSIPQGGGRGGSSASVKPPQAVVVRFDQISPEMEHAVATFVHETSFQFACFAIESAPPDNMEGFDDTEVNV